MKRRNAWILSIVAVVGLGASAKAATEGPLTTTTPIPTTLTDWTGGLAFPQFDPSLGTLTSVEVDLSGSFTTTISVMNTGDSASSGTVNTELQLTVDDAGSNLNTPELDLLSPAFAYSLGAGGSTSSGLLSKNGSDDESYTLPAVLSEFTGLGSINLPASTFTQTLLANTGGNTSAAQVTDASLTGDVIYTYTTSVPEPASLGLLSMGALAFLRRHRRAI